MDIPYTFLISVELFAPRGLMFFTTRAPTAASFKPQPQLVDMATAVFGCVSAWKCLSSSGPPSSNLQGGGRRLMPEATEESFHNAALSRRSLTHDFIKKYGLLNKTYDFMKNDKFA